MHLTKKPGKEHEGADRPAIEVTDRMIEAGVRAYYAVNMKVGDVEFRVSAVYEAMEEARLHQTSSDKKTTC